MNECPLGVDPTTKDLVVAKDVRKILTTLVERVDYLIETFSDEYPGLHENYSALMILYLREFEVIEVKEKKHWLLGYLLRKAIRKEMVNFTSLHRAITIAKKKFQDEKDRVRSDEKESEYQNVLAGWDDDEVDWGDTDV